MSMNLVHLLQKTARSQGDRCAIIGPRQQDRLTYNQLQQQVALTTDQLTKLGIGPGDCVGLHLPSGRDYILLSYAIWQCGACVVPLPVELTPVEKQQIPQHITINHMLSTPASVRMVESYRSGPLENIFENALLFPVRSPRQHPSGFEQINAAFIRFSSGTTGASKGVVLSHETIYQRIQAANEGLNIGPADRVIWLLSMSYHFAVSIVAYLSFGATIVLPENLFAVGILRAASTHRGTLIYGSPVQFLQMSKDTTGVMLPDLRLAISTTTALNLEIGSSFQKRFGLPLTQAYGIIEVGLPCINLKNATRHVDAVGQILPSYQIRLHDSGDASGYKEIHLRGKGFLDAYYDPWKTQREIMTDGWFHTGDLGEFCDEGCLHIRGRSKDVISVSGMKFFPQEVETVLQQHEAVREASVFSVSHRRLGEVPHAHVVLRAPNNASVHEELLRDHCRQYVAPYKVPERIFLVEKLERTASGKILRRPAEVTSRLDSTMSVGIVPQESSGDP